MFKNDHTTFDVKLTLPRSRRPPTIMQKFGMINRKTECRRFHRSELAGGSDQEAWMVSVPATPAPRRRRSGLPLDTLLRWLSPVLLLTVWELAVGSNILDHHFFPSPSAMIQVAWQDIMSEILGAIRLGACSASWGASRSAALRGL